MLYLFPATVQAAAAAKGKKKRKKVCTQNRKIQYIHLCSKHINMHETSSNNWLKSCSVNYSITCLAWLSSLCVLPKSFRCCVFIPFATCVSTLSCVYAQMNKVTRVLAIWTRKRLTSVIWPEDKTVNLLNVHEQLGRACRASASVGEFRGFFCCCLFCLFSFKEKKRENKSIFRRRADRPAL